MISKVRPNTHILYTHVTSVGLSRWLSGKESACQSRRCKRHGFDPSVGKITWSRKWQPTPVLLPGKFHGQRSLVGYSLWGCKESDITEHAYMHSRQGQRARPAGPVGVKSDSSDPGNMLLPKTYCLNFTQQRTVRCFVIFFSWG